MKHTFVLHYISSIQEVKFNIEVLTSQEKSARSCIKKSKR